MRSCEIFYFSLTVIYMTKCVYGTTKDNFIKSIQDIETRLVDLDSTLDKLISDVRKIKLELTGQHSQSQSKNGTVVSSLVDILTIKRRWTAGGFNFTITYRSLADDLQVIWMDFKSNLSASSWSLDAATNVTTIVYPERGNPHGLINVMFSSYKKLEGIEVVMSIVNGTGTNVLSNITLPRLELSTTSDLTYQKGQNLTIKMNYSPRSPQGTPHIVAEVVDLNNLKFTTAHSNSELMEISKSDGEIDEININIKTSLYEVSGVLLFWIEHSMQDSFVSTITYHLTKVLRPETVKEPYPDRYLDLRGNNLGGIDDGIQYVHAKANESVFMHCKARGRNISAISWKRHSKNGTQTDVKPDYKISSFPYSYVSGMSVLADSTVLKDTLFTCTAFNGWNVSATLTFQVKLEMEEHFWTWQPSDPKDGLSNNSSSSVMVPDGSFRQVPTVNGRQPTASPTTPVSGIQSTASPTSEDAFTACVEILNLTRTTADDGFYFTVTYRPLVQDVSATWSNGTNVLQVNISNDKDMQDYSVCQDIRITKVFYLIKEVLFPHLEVVFESLSTQSKVVIVFSMSHLEERVLYSYNTPIPALQVLTNGDIVYKFRQDAIVKIRSKTGSGTNEVEIDAFLDLVNIDTEEAIYSQLKRNDLSFPLIEIAHRVLDKESFELDIRLLTSQNLLSGFVTFYARQTISTAMIDSITMYTRKTLRPFQLAGAFPENILLLRATNIDKDHVIRCRVGEVCQLSCEAFAKDIESVTLDEITKNGQPNSKRFLTSTTQKRDFTIKVSKTLWFESTDKLMFQCTARTIDNHYMIRLFEVLSVLKLGILPQLSMVSVIEAKGKSKPRYNITCVVQASQKPNVSLRFNFRSSKERNVHVASDMVKQESPVRYRVSRQRTFDPTSPDTLLATVTCLASTPHETASRTMTVPVIHE